MNRGIDLMLWGKGEQSKQKNMSCTRCLRVDRFHISHTHTVAFVAAVHLSVHVGFNDHYWQRCWESCTEQQKKPRGYRYLDIVVTHKSLWLQCCSRTAIDFAEDSSWKLHCYTVRNWIYCYRKFLSPRQLDVRPFLDQNVKEKKKCKCFTNLHSAWINSAAEREWLWSWL